MCILNFKLYIKIFLCFVTLTFITPVLSANNIPGGDFEKYPMEFRINYRPTSNMELVPWNHDFITIRFFNQYRAAMTKYVNLYIEKQKYFYESLRNCDRDTVEMEHPVIEQKELYKIRGRNVESECMVQTTIAGITNECEFSPKGLNIIVEERKSLINKNLVFSGLTPKEGEIYSQSCKIKNENYKSKNGKVINLDKNRNKNNGK